MLQDGDEIYHLGGRFLRLPLFLNLFPAGLHLLFDHFHERFSIIIVVFFRIPFCTHAVDQRFGHVHLALARLQFFRDMQPARVGEFFSEMHELENEHAIFRLHPGEILPRFNHHLCDSNLLAALERVTQEHVGFVATLLRLQIIWFIKKHWVDFIDLDEILDVYGLRCFQIDALKILILQHDVFPFFVFVSFYNLVPWHLFAVLFSNPFVVHRA